MTGSKELDVLKRRHAVSVLFRVFFEFTLDAYITKHGIVLDLDGSGKPKDQLLARLGKVVSHVRLTGLMNEKELKPLNVGKSDRHSFLSPETLNAYVHSPWMNPQPNDLKLTWAGIQLFMERVWGSQPKP